MNQDEHNWNAEKRDLRELSAEKMQERLTELKKEKQRMEINLRMNAHSNKRYGYHSIGKSSYKFIGGNLKKIRRTIAFVNMLTHGVNQSN